MTMDNRQASQLVDSILRFNQGSKFYLPQHGTDNANHSITLVIT